jgi:hypothetical protein
MSTLCRAKWRCRSGIRFTTKITKATKENIFLLLFVFFAVFVVAHLVPREVDEKRFGLLEKFGPFFEKLSHFNVKFRKFFGFYFFGNAQTCSNRGGGPDSLKNRGKYFIMSNLQNKQYECAATQSKAVQGSPTIFPFPPPGPVFKIGVQASQGLDYCSK